IRYRNVTGVQTCALPISIFIPVRCQPGSGMRGVGCSLVIQYARRQGLGRAGHISVFSASVTIPGNTEPMNTNESVRKAGSSLERSEERRVGKESGAGVGP